MRAPREDNSRFFDSRVVLYAWLAAWLAAWLLFALALLSAQLYFRPIVNAWFDGDSVTHLVID